MELAFARPPLQIQKSNRLISTSKRCRSYLQRGHFYNRIAIIGTVPPTFENAIPPPNTSPTISLTVANLQHQAYSYALSRCAPISRVLQVPSNPACPDSVFVEDPVIMLSNNVALLATPGHPSRQAETAALEPVLKRAGIMIRRSDVRIDGGDVLRIPGYMIVGLSQRTEPDALDVLQGLLRDLHEEPPLVIGVSVQGELHLKSVVTFVSTNGGFLVAQDNDVGGQVIQQIVQKTKNWDVMWVPHDERWAANVLDIDGHVLVQETCHKTVAMLQDRNVNVVPVDTSELAKMNGALTCMSIIV